MAELLCTCLAPVASVSFRTMESDNENDNHSSSDDSFEEEEVDSEEENSSDDGGDDPDTREYWLLVKQLFSSNDVGNCLRIQSRHDFKSLLYNVESFCSLLRPSLSLKRVSLGDLEGTERSRLLLQTQGDRNDWRRFSKAIGALEHLESLKMGGHILCPEAMIELVRCMPATVKEFEIHLPWFSLSEVDTLRTLIEVLSNHACQAISLELNGELPFGVNDPARKWAADLGILSLLLRVNGLKELSLRSLVLKQDECKLIADLISTNTCPIDFLHVSSCTFQSGSCKFVAEAFQRNTRLKRLYLTNMLSNDEMFRESLLNSLILNSSIEECHILYLQQADCSTIVEIIKNIARQNTTMKSIRVDVPMDSSKLSEQQEHELNEDLQQNYTLELVQIKNEEPFRIITTLNKAGRRYVCDEATNKSRCIQVLSNPLVNDHLDCLYYHLRENPILMFMPDHDRRTSKKRKAKDTPTHAEKRTCD